MKYVATNKRAIDFLLPVTKHVTSINKRLQFLVEIRILQINGYAFCVDMHPVEVRQLGVDNNYWATSPFRGRTNYFL